MEVHNFRSVEDATVEFDKGFNAIFGENGTGKSNLIRAVLKLLGPAYPGKNSFPPADHINADEARDIRIKMVFNDGATRTPLSWEPHGAGGPRLSLGGRPVNDSQRGPLCPIYFPASREVKELPGQNAWNPLGRILSELSKIIAEDAPVKSAFDTKAGELNQVLEQSAAYLQFKGKLRQYAAAHLGQSGQGLDLQLSLVDPEHALRTLQVFETQNGREYNAASSGLGIQSGIVMGALRAFAEVTGGRFFIVADEPEAYLHPLSQQALRMVLEKLASAGTQVIVTTHSPHFISADSLEGLHKIWMRGGLTHELGYRFSRHLTLLQGLGITTQTEATIRAKLGHHLSVEAREGLFAKSVVLCEGESEAGSLAVWAKSLGYDYATNGIAVVASHGKFSLPVLAMFYRTLELPCFIVFDSDSGKVGADRAKHAQTNRLLLKIVGAAEEDFPPTGAFGTHAVFGPDFERVVRVADPDYIRIEAEVNDDLGLRSDGAKGIRARYAALRYGERGMSTPTPIEGLVRAIDAFHTAAHTAVVAPAPAATAGTTIVAPGDPSAPS